MSLSPAVQMDQILKNEVFRMKDRFISFFWTPPNVPGWDKIDDLRYKHGSYLVGSILSDHVRWLWNFRWRICNKCIIYKNKFTFCRKHTQACFFARSLIYSLATSLCWNFTKELASLASCSLVWFSLADRSKQIISNPCQIFIVPERISLWIEAL